MYRLFDGAVACDFPLPGIPEVQQAVADLRVTLGQGAVSEAAFDWFHSWCETDGELVLSCARKNIEGGSPQYIMRFPELADFVIDGNAITCHPQPDCRDDSLCHLVLDQVVPRVWAHRGNLVLHASAVQLPNGRVVAFTGESGWGKSTLAAALQSQGSHLLSDDCINLRVNDEGVQLIPSYVGLRLNNDSIETLDMGGLGWGNVSHYSDKQRLAPATSAGSEPMNLHTLYMMEEPCDAPSLSMTALAGAELITTLIKRSFLLDINDSECATGQMREAAAVLRAMPRIYCLDYPRDYQQLPALCHALLEAEGQV
jgi:hypothetical protein